jgi:hypothetical protein
MIGLYGDLLNGSIISEDKAVTAGRGAGEGCGSGVKSLVRTAGWKSMPAASMI